LFSLFTNFFPTTLAPGRATRNATTWYDTRSDTRYGDSVYPPVAQRYGTPLERRPAERAETPQEWRGAPLGGGGSASGSELLEGSTIRRNDARTTASRMTSRHAPRADQLIRCPS